jgi:hypothetical protein
MGPVDPVDPIGPVGPVAPNSWVLPFPSLKITLPAVAVICDVPRIILEVYRLLKGLPVAPKLTRPEGIKLELRAKTDKFETDKFVTSRVSPSKIRLSEPATDPLLL